MASRIEDCSLWQAVWLAPTVVRRHPVDGADAAPLSWAELMAEAKGTLPFESIAMSGSRPGANHWWSWSPQWEAAVGQALAHLLAASEGCPVTVPDGLIAEVFQRALDSLLPAGPPARRAVLAGPAAPDAYADILLLPAHPQTGETWTPAGPAASAYPVPLPFGVRRWPVLPEPYQPVPASGGMPDSVLRDDPARAAHLSSVPGRPGRVSASLVRTPAVRSLWLPEILENLPQHMRARLF
ncbi:hypothetical protein [Streptomyces mirabilis]|uniref:hypothetical protein n=1 Tax=Streptomyces mirabilis TaxID=68239 RepID=UPI0036EF003C